MTGSIAGAVNFFFLPNISQWSDHTRSRWGRRIPFLWIVAPLTVISMVGIGFAPEIAGVLHVHLLARLAPTASLATTILVLLCVLVASYHFFNMVLVNIYNWLLRDVVPEELMARFLSWFRIVGTVSSVIFLRYVFPHVIVHRKEVCVGIGLFYLVSFFLMCRNVKEGEYPLPPPIAERPGIVRSFILYFRECLALSIYRNFFIASLFALSAWTCSGPFGVLFVRETLGLNMDDMGKMFAWGSAASAVAFVPIGWLCDRFSAMRIALLSLVGLVISPLLACFFVTDKESFFVYTLLSVIPSVGWGLSSQAVSMKLFPEEKFGQFSSGLNVFGFGAVILGNYLMGQFMDLVHSNYRMSYVWSALLSGLAVLPMLLVYRGWKQHGGPDRYVAPLPEVSSSRVFGRAH